MFAEGPGETRADEAGDLVLFRDVEDALRDSTRFKWLLPTFSADDEVAGDRRNRALSRLHRQGLRGVKLVDQAMKDCPE